MTGKLQGVLAVLTMAAASLMANAALANVNLQSIEQQLVQDAKSHSLPNVKLASAACGGCSGGCSGSG
jgi:hypothetical protein